MSFVTKARGLAVALGGCVALLSAASAAAAPPGYTATRPVPGVAQTSVTVTASGTESTITITSSNAKILADVAGKRLQVGCQGAPNGSLPGVDINDLNVAVWREGSSSLSVKLAAPLLSGKSYCGTSVLADHRSVSLSAYVQITAPAPVPVERSATAALDPATSFQLDGSTLTVTSTNREFLKVVRGRTVFGVCDSGVTNLARWLKSSGYYRGRVVTVFGREVRWAAGAHSATVTLPADISGDVDVCEFGLAPGSAPNALGNGSPGVRASFDAPGAKYIADERASELTRIRRGLEQAYRLANSDRAGARSWPSSKALAQALAHSAFSPLTSTPSQIDPATNISDVTAIGPMYIVDAGSPDATLELAELDDYGVVHALTVRIGGQPHISADPRGRV